MNLTRRIARWTFAALLVATTLPGFTATFIVTNTADSGPGSLREAVGFANVNGADDTVSFAPSLAGQTIRLTTGELAIDESGTTLTISADGLPGGVVINGNSATRVFDLYFGATVVMDSLTVTDGHDDYGAGILSEATLTLRRCHVTRNVARSINGGGLYQFGGFLTIDQTTFSENVAVGESEARGGAAYLLSATADIVNSTFSGNTAAAGSASSDAQGGALYQIGGGISIRHCTFTRNRAHGLNSYGGAWLMGGLGEASHTIFAENEALFGPEIYTGVSTINSSGYNFVGIGTSALGITNGVNGDRTGTASRPLRPLLGPLQFNGGIAPTHAPLACSPVIDAAFNTPSAPDVDQRGLPRLVNGVLPGGSFPRLDIGAVEAGPVVVVTTASDSADGLHLGGLSLREALAIARAPGTRILFDTAAFAEPVIDLDPGKGPLVVNSGNVFIDASMLPSQLVLNGRGAMRILEISNRAEVALANVRFVNGRAGAGGGLRCAAGSGVSLDRCAFVSCVATNGGGAIANSGRMMLHDGLFLGNAATRGHGGAIDNTGGELALVNSVISENTAGAGNGGGIRNVSGARLLLSQSIVQHNNASGSGGGIYNGGTNAPAETALRHSTIAFNTSGQPGGGVANSNLLRSSHTLFAGNRRGVIPDDFSGAASSDGYNMLGSSTGSSGFTAAGDVRDAEARLRGVNWAHGTVYTLEPNSPAIDAGFNTTSSDPDDLAHFAGLLPRDVSGEGRIANGPRVDIGAAEFQPRRSFATNGIPWPVPGRVEAEDFDIGGPGVGYSDTTPLNLGGEYRLDDGVDIEAAVDDGGGYSVTSPASGEWLNYTIEVRSSGRYTLLLRVATDAPSGALRVEIDGVDLTGTVSIPNTGGEQDWTTLVRTGIELTGGRHVMRIVWGTGSANLNFIEFQAEEAQHGLTRLLYLNRGGSLLSDFYPGPRGQAAFPSNPEPFGATPLTSGRVATFESPSHVADDYGVILAGYLEPSQSGWYTFYLCANNQGELWLSSDENPANSVLIATEPEGNPARTWVDGVARPAVDGIPANVSMPIFLEACKRYYVEAIAKEGDGIDNLAVTWRRYGEAPPTNGAAPIDAAWLRPLLSTETAAPAGNAWSIATPQIVPSFQSFNSSQPGAFVEFRVLADTVGPVRYDWLVNGVPVSGTNFMGADSAVLRIVNPTPAMAGFYTVLVRNASTTASATAVLGVQDNIAPDTVAPMLAATSPAPATVTVTNSVFTLSGRASDDRRVLAVLVSGDGFTNRVAIGSSNWFYTAVLSKGTNRFFVRAVDDAGNTSAFATRAVLLPGTNRLSLTIAGQGTVSPNLTNAPLFVGRTYRLTATPRPGFVFAGWTGDVSSPSNVLNFRMAAGLALQANFVVNPFPTLKGSYNGLFYQTNEVRHENSGFITATVTELGAFSGRLLIGGKTVRFSGRFTPDGVARLRLPRRGAATLTLELRLPLDRPPQLVGGLSDGSWVAELLADRAVFGATNPAPYAGRHTLFVPSVGAISAPEGDGYGALSVSTAGRVNFGGVLAEGTAASQSVPVGPGGEWPFYAALYGGKGSILGWLTFATNNPDESIGGLVNWVKPPLPSPKLYTNGFAIQTLATGSSYVPPTTNRVLGFTNGVVHFTDGLLVSSPVSFNVGLTLANRVTHTNGSAFSMSITVANGLFSGTFIPPETNAPLRFRGAVHQQGELGAGFFLNRGVSGRVSFERSP